MNYVDFYSSRIIFDNMLCDKMSCNAMWCNACDVTRCITLSCYSHARILSYSLLTLRLFLPCLLHFLNTPVSPFLSTFLFSFPIVFSLIVLPFFFLVTILAHPCLTFPFQLSFPITFLSPLILSIRTSWHGIRNLLSLQHDHLLRIRNYPNGAQKICYRSSYQSKYWNVQQ